MDKVIKSKAKRKIVLLKKSENKSSEANLIFDSIRDNDGKGIEASQLLKVIKKTLNRF